jgi:hypothetical protein
MACITAFGTLSRVQRFSPNADANHPGNDDGARAQAAVLYNLAAVQCQQAVAADRSSDDGIKLACHLFQMAAGACAHLRDAVGLKVRSRIE